jgi:hypothetical protein
MNKVMLANIDYLSHMTSEGNELQQGLKEAGWTLTGKGFDDLQDCRQIVDKYEPDIVVVHDRRDWDERLMGSFRRDIAFNHLEALHQVPVRIAVVKDAGSMVQYHKFFAEEIKATALLTYYHERSINMQAPWMGDYPQIRTYHSVDAQLIKNMSVCYTPESRRRGIVTGALSQIYPLRWEIQKHCNYLNIHDLPHPGYHNRGHHTQMYLGTLASYKVHIATASLYHFALRKIIESVAMGCIPVTNLPNYDELPEIDGALLRVNDWVNMQDLRSVIDMAEEMWNLGPEEKRRFWVDRCLNFYDFRALGKRLNWEIEAHPTNMVGGRICV